MMDALFINYMSQPIINAVQVILVALVCLSAFELTPFAFKQGVRDSFASLTQKSRDETHSVPDIFVRHSQLVAAKQPRVVSLSLRGAPILHVEDGRVLSIEDTLRSLNTDEERNALIRFLNRQPLMKGLPLPRAAYNDARFIDTGDLHARAWLEQQRFAGRLPV